jgi:fibronectin type 3 domain-containing protein
VATAITAVALDQPQYVDSTPPAGGPSTYTVREVDQFGNLSPASKAVIVNGDETSITGPVDLEAKPSRSGVTLSWEPVLDAQSYRMYRREAGPNWKLLESELTTLTYADSDVVEDTTYDYTVRAVMPSGQLTALSATATAVATDSPQETPTSVAAVLDDDAQLSDPETYVPVSVSGATGDELNASIDGDPVGSWPLSCTTECELQWVLIDSATLGLGDHTLVVELERDSEVVATDEVDFTLIGDPAAAPTGITAAVSDTGEVTLGWQPSISDAVTGYQVARASATTATVGSLQYTDPVPLGVAESRTYSLSAVSACCVSQTPATITVHDTDHLAAPTGLAVHQAGGAAALSWTASAGATSYDVFRASTSGGPWDQITPSGISTTTYTDYDVAPSNDYYYAIRAQSGTRVAALSASSMVHIDAPTGAAPTVTLSGPLVDAQGQTLSEGSKALSIHATEPSGAVLRLEIGLDDEPVLDQHQSCAASCDFDFGWTFTPSEYDDGAHVLSVTATDALGKQFTQELSVLVNATAPDQIEHLAATQNATAVLLQWEPAYAQDLADYQLQRAEGDADFVTVQTIAATSHQATDSTVAAGRSYRYRVIGRDQTGNTSEPSDAVGISFGGAAVTAPTGLTATPAPYSVSLTWSLSTESDLAGYHVYRRWHATDRYELVNDGLVSGASFVDDHVAPEDTPEYLVKAANRTGYESPASASVSVQVPHLVAAPLARHMMIGDAYGDDELDPTWTHSPACDVPGPNTPCTAYGALSLTSDGQGLLPPYSDGTMDTINLGTGARTSLCVGQFWQWIPSGWYDSAAGYGGLPRCGPPRGTDHTTVYPNSHVPYAIYARAGVAGPGGKFAVRVEGWYRNELVEQPGTRVIDGDFPGVLPEVEPDRFVPLRYTADGTLYYQKFVKPAYDQATCQLWRRSATGAAQRVYLRPGDDPCNSAISPDGSGYVPGNGTDIRFRSFDGQIDRRLDTVSGPNLEVWPMVASGISADGERLAYGVFNSVSGEGDYYSTAIDGGHSRPYAGRPNAQASDDVTYAAAESSLAIKIDEATAGNGQDPVSISGEVVATNTTVQDVKLVVGTTSQNVTLTSGHFNVTVARSGLPEGRIKARIVATSADGIERSATTDVVVDRSAPLAPRAVKIESTTVGTGRITWDKLKDSVLPDGSEGSGVASLSYRYRKTDLSWSGWSAGELDGVSVPTDTVGDTVETKVEDNAGNVKQTKAKIAANYGFVNCTPVIQQAIPRTEDATVDDLRHFTPTRVVIDGEFVMACFGHFDSVDFSMRWLYNTGGDHWQTDQTKSFKKTVHFDDVQGHDIPGLPTVRQYPFNRTSPCPAGAADGDNGTPYHNWAIAFKATYHISGHRDVNKHAIVDQRAPTHFECPNEAQRRAWRVAAYKQVASYSPVLDTPTYYRDPSQALRQELAHDGPDHPDHDAIPMPVSGGWAAHHIVPIRDYQSPDPAASPDYTDNLRQAMFACHIHPNSPVNGLYLRDRGLTRYVRNTRTYNQNWLDLIVYDGIHDTNYAESTHHYDTQESRGADYPTAIGKVITPGYLPQHGWCTASQHTALVGRLRLARKKMRKGTLGSERKEHRDSDNYWS